MAKSPTRERTVSFFEIVIEKDGAQERCTQLDFPTFLAGLANTPVKDRIIDTSQRFVGSIYIIDEIDHLLLHRVKDVGEWLSVMDLETGQLTELESKASEGYLETTAISFLEFGNVVGLMQGSTSSPSHKALEEWLNVLKPFGSGTVFAVRPLMSKAEIEALAGADGASRVDIRIGRSKSAALAEKQGRLARALRSLNENYGDVRVTVSISIPPGGARAEDRRQLLDDLKDLDEVMPGAADVAKAKLVYSDAGGAEYARLREFVEHHITAKRQVPAVDDKGNSIKLASALRIIELVSTEHEEELRLAADAPKDEAS